MKKKVKIIPNIDKFQFNKTLYILKLLSIAITVIIFIIYFTFNLVMKFKLFNPELNTFYTLQLPNILIILASLIGLYKELVGAILVVFILFIKIVFDQYDFNIFIDVLLINALINLYLFWSLVRDKNQ